MALQITQQALKTSLKLCVIRKMFHGNAKTAGILVIGDELLKGDVIDTNSPHMTKQLHKLGVKVKKISVIGDVVDEISNEVELFSKSYSYVITTGGIGPTHDDMTFEAVAKAFNVPLALNDHLRSLCENYYKTTDINHPGMKLANVPKTAKLIFSEGNNYPNVYVENVYMFPGIPELFLKSFNFLSPKLFKCNTHFHSKVLYVSWTEDKIAVELSKLASRFPEVQIGSYPKLFDKLYKVKITLESENEEKLKEAFDVLLTKIPATAIVDLKQ